MEISIWRLGKAHGRRRRSLISYLAQSGTEWQVTGALYPEELLPSVLTPRTQAIWASATRHSSPPSALRALSWRREEPNYVQYLLEKRPLETTEASRLSSPGYTPVPTHNDSSRRACCWPRETALSPCLPHLQVSIDIFVILALAAADHDAGGRRRDALARGPPVPAVSASGSSVPIRLLRGPRMTGRYVHSLLVTHISCPEY
jgi:hypothetical protein